MIEFPARRAAVFSLLTLSFFIPMAGIFSGPSRAAAADYVIVDIAEPEQPPASEAVPERFELKGLVVDWSGEPVGGALVQARNRDNRAWTGQDGWFALPEPITSDQRVRIEHRRLVDMEFPARRLYSGQQGVALVRVPAITAEFTLDPAGSTHAADGVTVEAPAGAVTSPTLIRVALLPLDFAYDDSPDIQTQRLFGAWFEPSGLTFNEPVRVTVPNRYVPASAAGERVYRFDNDTRRFVEDSQTAVERDKETSTLTLQQFSRYASGSPDEGVQRRLVRHGHDIDGDGRISAHDAEFIVILSGGEHRAEWEQTTGVGVSVMRTTSRQGTRSESSSESVSAGVSIGGVGVEVGAKVSQSETETEATKAGVGDGVSRAESLKFTLNTPEYDTDCRYFLRWYEFWRVRTWQPHEPTEPDLPGLEDWFNNHRQNPDAEWGYARIRGGSGIAMERNLYDGDLVAARRTDDGIEFHRLVSERLVRVPKGGGFHSCDAEDLTGQANNAAPGQLDWFRPGRKLEEARLIFSQSAGPEYMTVRDLGWGILPGSTPERFGRVECGNEVGGSITISSEREELDEQEFSRTREQSESESLEVKIEVPLPLGAKAGGGAAIEQQRSQTRTYARNYRATLSTEIETVIQWNILDPHKPEPLHESNHERWLLHRLLEYRPWQYLFESELPAEVRNLPDDDSGTTFVGLDDGEILMRDHEGRWYVSGPPVIETSEAGLLLVRRQEGPCPGMPRQPDPGTPREPDLETQPVDELEQDDDRTTRSDWPPRETDPDDSGSSASEDQHPDETSDRSDEMHAHSRIVPRISEYSASVTFTALEGRTLITRDTVGEIQSVDFVAVDGEPIGAEEAQATVTEHDEYFEIAIASAAVAAMVIHGSRDGLEVARTAALPADVAFSEIDWDRLPEPGPPPPGTVRIADDLLEVSDGRVVETIRISPDYTEPDHSPGAHQVRINGAAAEVVALRSGELAVVGQDIPLSAADGTSTIEVVSPSGQRLTATAPGWGFELTVPPVARVNQTVDIRLQVVGLHGHEAIEFEFVPGPGQQITPATVVVRGDQASTGLTAAQLRAGQPGPQALNFRLRPVLPGDGEPIE